MLLIGSVDAGRMNKELTTENQEKRTKSNKTPVKTTVHDDSMVRVRFKVRIGYSLENVMASYKTYSI